MKIAYMTVVAMMLGGALSLAAPSSHAQSTDAGNGQAKGIASAPPQMNRQAMMTDMQAAGKRLDDLVAQMNATTGPDKIERIAAVVNELAAMHKRMSMMMQGGMMQTPAGEHGSVAPSPGTAGGAAHSEHHTP